MSKQIYLLGEDAAAQFEENSLRFRLTYEGPLPSTQNDARLGQKPKHAELKHEMRQHFHRQLAQVWATHPSLVGWYLEDDFHARERRRVGWRNVKPRRVNYGINRAPLLKMVRQTANTTSSE